MKAKVLDHPHLTKCGGSVINNDKNALKQRKQALANIKKLAVLEQNQAEMENKFNDMSTKLDLILNLLQGDKQ